MNHRITEYHPPLAMDTYPCLSLYLCHHPSLIDCFNHNFLTMASDDTKQQSNAALVEPLLPSPDEEPVVAFASDEDIEQGAYSTDSTYSVLRNRELLSSSSFHFISSPLLSFSHFGSGIVDSG
jgi:hypothetical protein